MQFSRFGGLNVRLKRVLLLLILVALLSCASFYLILKDSKLWFGINTGQFKITYSLLGAVNLKEELPGDLTPLLQKYCGPLPEETDWELVRVSGSKLNVVLKEGGGEHAMWAAKFFADLISNQPSRFTCERRLKYDMADEAKRESLRQFELAMQGPLGWAIAGYYTGKLEGAVADLDRPACAEDIPRLSDFYVER
jgi:hypothetical protein